MYSQIIEDFVRESNKIEGIIREPTKEELEYTATFVDLPTIGLEEVIKLVSIYEPMARIRDRSGLDVRVGNHIAPRGGPEIKIKLNDLLFDINIGKVTPFIGHCRYLYLHPFMDGNGRSGRAVWLWQMKRKFGRLPSLGFKHTFYYQTLDYMDVTSEVREWVTKSP